MPIGNKFYDYMMSLVPPMFRHRFIQQVPRVIAELRQLSEPYPDLTVLEVLDEVYREYERRNRFGRH